MIHGRIDERGLYVRKTFREEWPDQPGDTELVHRDGKVVLVADGVVQATFESEAMAKVALPAMKLSCE